MSASEHEREDNLLRVATIIAGCYVVIMTVSYAIGNLLF